MTEGHTSSYRIPINWARVDPPSVQKGCDTGGSRNYEREGFVDPQIRQAFSATHRLKPELRTEWFVDPQIRQAFSATHRLKPELRTGRVR